MKKKVMLFSTAALCAMMMSLSVGATAVYASSTNNNSVAVELPQASAEDLNKPVTVGEETPSLISVSGTVMEIGDNQITIKTTTGEYPEVTLNISDETYIIDNTKKTPSSIKEIKKGDTIQAYFGQAMTRSIPPQASAKAIIVNIEKDKAPATFLTVAKVTKTDNGVQVLSTDNNYLITITDKTPVTPYKTKQVMTIDDIKQGTELFAWFEIMTMSLPAQATADAVVIAGQAEPTNAEPVKTETQTTTPTPAPIEAPAANGPVTTLSDKVKTDAQNIYIGSATIPASGVKAELIGNEYYLPIRPIAEAMGLKVEWDATRRMVVVNAEVIKYQIPIDQKYFIVDNDMVYELSAAPVIVDNKAYVPVKIFDQLVK